MSDLRDPAARLGGRALTIPYACASLPPLSLPPAPYCRDHHFFARSVQGVREEQEGLEEGRERGAGRSLSPRLLLEVLLVLQDVD